MAAPAPPVARPTVALFSLTGCGGNRLALLELEGALADVVDLRPDDLDVRADLALVDGAVLGRQDEEKLLAIRDQADTLVALGTCAVHGGVGRPARPICDVVAIDAAITGCPAEPAEVLGSLASLLRGDPPLPRSYPVCTECRIRETRCVLADADAICLGPVTAAGCDARCPTHGIGCFGCRGPAPDANWASALDLFTDRGSDPDDVVLKMRTFAPAPVGRPRLHREPEERDPGGFERRIVGRSWDDVPKLVSRISARSAVAHSQTAVRVIERAFDVNPTVQTNELRDLLWRGQAIACHAEELGRLAAPRDALTWASEAARQLRELGSAIKAGIGGHAVHVVNSIPGGFGRVPDERTLHALRERLDGASDDVEALVDMVRALPPGRAVDVDPAYLALRQDERYRYDAGDQVVILAAGERWTLAAEALPKVLAEYAAPLVVGPLARLAINDDRVGPLGSGLLAALGVDPGSPDATTHHRARAIELAVDVRRAMETLDGLLDAGLTAGREGISPRTGLGVAAAEAPGGLVLYSVAFDAPGRVRTATIMTPGSGSP